MKDTPSSELDEAYEDMLRTELGDIGYSEHEDDLDVVLEHVFDDDDDSEGE